MKRFCIWLLLEYKRAVKILPFVLAEAMVLMCFIGTIAFCAQKATDTEHADEEKPVIAVAAEEENRLLDMAVSYIEGMKSVESICRFEKMNYEEGKRALQNGEVIAMIVLPNAVVEGILNGTNQPAALYLPKDMSAAGKVFEALADAGIGMLQTAQAEIYTINDIAVAYDRTDTISDMEYDINIFNINLALNRENVFKMRSLSVTENLSVINYYGSAGMVLYLLLAGLSLCTYFERENPACERRLRLAGVSATGQTFGKVLVVFSVLIVSSLIPAVLYGLLQRAGILTVYFSPANLLSALLCILCTSVILVFIYRIAGSIKSALLFIGIGSILLCFLSGIFIPYALLPSPMRTLAEFLPTTWMKQLWGAWLHKGEAFWPAILKTAGFSALLFLVTCLISQRKGEKRG